MERLVLTVLTVALIGGIFAVIRWKLSASQRGRK